MGYKLITFDPAVKRRRIVDSDLIGGGGAVASVFGRTGVVIAQSADYVSFYQPLAARLTQFSAITPTTGQFLRAGSGGGLPWEAALLVAGDIPLLDVAKISTGTFDIARLPVGTSGSTVCIGNDSRITAATSHAANTSNPHSVTAAQVGNATAQWNANQIQGVAIPAPSGTNTSPIFNAGVITWGAPSGTSNVDDFSLVALAGYPNAYSESSYDASGAITEQVWKTAPSGTVLLRHTFTYPSSTVSVRVETSYRPVTPISRTVTITESSGLIARVVS